MENQIILDRHTSQTKTLFLSDEKKGTDLLPYTTFDLAAGVKLDFIAHWHPEYEIIFLLDQYIDFIVDGVMYHLKPGEALFLHGDAIHGHADFNACYGRYLCFSFGEDFLSPDPKSYLYNRFFAPLRSGALSFTKHITGGAAYEGEILELLQQLRLLNENIPENALSIQVCLLHIFDILFRENALAPAPEALPKKEIIKSALWYINRNYTAPITIQDISKFLSVSTDHFARIFKAATASTPKEYIQDLRIRHALYEMNAHPACRLSEVAENSGFSDPNYFARAFKSKLGLTPSDYLKLPKATPPPLSP